MLRGRALPVAVGPAGEEWLRLPACIVGAFTVLDSPGTANSAAVSRPSAGDRAPVAAPASRFAGKNAAAD